MFFCFSSHESGYFSGWAPRGACWWWHSHRDQWRISTRHRLLYPCLGPLFFGTKTGCLSLEMSLEMSLEPSLLKHVAKHVLLLPCYPSLISLIQVSGLVSWIALEALASDQVWASLKVRNGWDTKSAKPTGLLNHWVETTNQRSSASPWSAEASLISMLELRNRVLTLNLVGGFISDFPHGTWNKIATLVLNRPGCSWFWLVLWTNHWRKYHEIPLGDPPPRNPLLNEIIWTIPFAHGTIGKPLSQTGWICEESTSGKKESTWRQTLMRNTAIDAMITVCAHTQSTCSGRW